MISHTFQEAPIKKAGEEPRRVPAVLSTIGVNSYFLTSLLHYFAFRPLAQNQFAAAIPNVTSTTANSPHRAVVSSNPVKIRATAANAVPPGNRKAAPPDFFRRTAGNAAATAPYINSLATAESVAFHRKSPESENTSSSAANAKIEICGVRNRG